MRLFSKTFISTKIFLAFILLSIFVANSSIFAQDSLKVNKVKLLSGNILSFNKTINPDFQIIKENVIFEYEQSLLYCDLVHLYIDRDYVVCFGNVHIIINDTTNIYGDTLIIDGDKNLAEIIGNVLLVDNKMTLKTSRLFYDLNSDIAYYLEGAEITDPKNFLSSKRGYYYSKINEFYFSDSVYIKGTDSEMFSDTLLYHTKTEVVRFFGNSKIISENKTMLSKAGTYDTKNDIGKFSNDVQIFSGSQILKGDSIYYNKMLEFGEAFKNVEFQDTVENVILNGEYGKFFENDSSFFVTQKALMRMIDNADTLYLHADTIYSLNNAPIHNQRIIFAHKMVRIFRDDFQAKCDSLVLLSKDSIMFLFFDPIMWMEETQLIADTIKLEYADGKMNKLFLNNNSFIVSKENENDFSQIKSKHMIGHFVENELDVLWAYENAESLYYVFDNSKLLIGINKTTSEKIRIKFEERAVDNISFYKSPKGNMSPEDELNVTDKLLQGFRWENSIRPKHKFDVFRNPDLQTEAFDLSFYTDSNFIFTDSILVDTIAIDTLQIDSDNTNIRGKGRGQNLKTDEEENKINPNIKKRGDKLKPEEDLKAEKRKFFLVRWVKSFFSFFSKSK